MTRLDKTSLVSIAIDVASVLLAFVLSLKLRLALGGWLFAAIDSATLSRVTPSVWEVLGFRVVSAWWARLYRPRTDRESDTLIHIVQATGLATILVVLVSFALDAPAAGLSRAFLALFFVVGVICHIVLRYGVWVGIDVIRSSSSADAVRVLVVGQYEDAALLVDRLLRAPGDRVVVSGLLVGRGSQHVSAPVAPLLGTVRDLRRAINQTRADRVIVVDTKNLALEELAECVEVCAAMHISLSGTGDMLNKLRTPVGVTEIVGVRLWQIQPSEFERARDLVKRATDLVLAGVLGLILLPLFVLLAIAIKLDSPGPILFVADRVGFGGRHFRFYKFRTMVLDAEARRTELLSLNEQSSPLFKIHGDPRVTTIGRLIRRLSLDELPQLLNVIRGDMSLVGPRPLPVRDLDIDGPSTRHQRWSLERATVRPGITGLWQVRGRSALPFEEMMRLETLYVQTRSYRLDLQILVETIPAVWTGRGAA